MKVSICITVFNEEGSIEDLIASLVNQSKKADEIVIVDGGSTDNTYKILKRMAKTHKLLNVYKNYSSRSKGRNYSVKMAKYNLITMTDAGCVAKSDWLEKLTKPFSNNNTQVVAGFYDMVGNTSFQKAEAVFLGVMPHNFNNEFLPSTRSIAFRKSVWKSVGGFPEGLDDTAEDTIFNYKLLENSVKIIRVKSARVEWMMPETQIEFSNKIFAYAKGDAKSKKLIIPKKSITSHNIKILLKFVRYSIALIVFLLGFSNPLFWYVFELCLAIYLYWSFYKVYNYYKDMRVGLWGIVLQITSDVFGIIGFLAGF